MSAAPFVLIAEDDQGFAMEVRDCFALYSIETRIASTWPELVLALAQDPALILLDKRLGHTDTLARFGQIRGRTDAPILVVTGYGEAPDCVVSLELGADGYLAKPVGAMELVVRSRAAMRRVGRAARRGDIRLDAATRTLHLVDGREVKLSGPQAALLWRLLEETPGGPDMPRLLDAVWQRSEGDDATAPVWMSLRRRLRRMGLAAATGRRRA